MRRGEESRAALATRVAPGEYVRTLAIMTTGDLPRVRRGEESRAALATRVAPGEYVWILAIMTMADLPRVRRREESRAALATLDETPSASIQNKTHAFFAFL